MMSLGEWVLAGLLAAIVGFVVYCPIFKPWFGFRRPKDVHGKWLQ